MNFVFPAARLEAGWRGVAGQLTTGPSIACRLMAENINRATVVPWERGSSKVRGGEDVLEVFDAAVTSPMAGSSRRCLGMVT